MTLGVLVGYVVGKPVGVVVTAWAVTLLSRGRIRPPVGWAAVLGSGTIAGVGFTVALLIATRAFQGPELDQAKVGALTRRRRVGGTDVGGVPVDGAAPARGQGAGADRQHDATSRTSCRRSTPSTTTSAAR